MIKVYKKGVLLATVDIKDAKQKYQNEWNDFKKEYPFYYGDMLDWLMSKCMEVYGGTVCVV